jgi:hypothetical protein
MLSCQQHRGRAALVLATGVGTSFEKSLYGSGTTRAYGTVQRGHSAFIGDVWIGACFEQKSRRAAVVEGQVEMSLKSLEDWP